MESDSFFIAYHLKTDDSSHPALLFQGALLLMFKIFSRVLFYSGVLFYQGGHSRGVGMTNFALKEQILFPGDEKSSLVGKQGRKSFPISPQGKNILPWGRKIFPCWETGKKILPHFSLWEEYSSLGRKNLPLLVGKR